MRKFLVSGVFKWQSFLLKVWVSLTFFALPWVYAHADQVLSLNPRPEVKLDLLLWEPYPAKPDTVILLLPGGPGKLDLSQQNGQIKTATPYLYSKQRGALLSTKAAVVVVNAPSDQADLTQSFRLSAAHAQDLSVAVAEVRRRFPAARLVLLAHSRGTLSAGAILQTMPEQVSAAILFAGLYQASQPGPDMPSAGPGLSNMNWSEIKTPILAIHHQYDACPVAPYAAALASKLELITVAGQPEARLDNPCGPASNHWFASQEAALVVAIKRWLARQYSK